MNKYIEMLLGIILIVVPILIVTLIPAFYNWFYAAVEFLKGGVVIGLIAIGILILIIGITD